MSLLDWLSKSLKSNKTGVSTQEILEHIDENAMTEICSREFYSLVAINLISNIYSSLEIRTYMYGKEVKGDEYYIWNIQPNRNQSAPEFKKEIIANLFRKNRILIVEENKQLIIADGFLEKEDNVIKEKVFCNVTKGTWTSQKEYKMSEVIYTTLNNTNIKALLDSINEGYKRIAQKAIVDYEKANGRKGIMKIDTVAQNKKFADKTFTEVYQDLMENRFQKYFKSPNAVLPLFEGFNYEEKDSGSKGNKVDLANDFIKVNEGQAVNTALAFNISPQLLKGNVEGLGDAVKNTMQFCIKPTAGMIDTSINRSRYGKKVLQGCYVKSDMTSACYIDIFSIGEKVDKLIASGFSSIDELRRCAAMPEVGIPETQKHYITKNYEEITSVKGGNEEDGTEDPKKDTANDDTTTKDDKTTTGSANS